MNSRIRSGWLAATLSIAAGCGDDSTTQVPPRERLSVVPPTTETAESPATAAQQVAPAPTQGVAVGALMPALDVARAMLAIVQGSERTGITATSTDGATFQLVLAPDVDATRATALARSLGNVSTTPIAWPPTTPLFSVDVLAIRGGTSLYLAPNTNAEVLAVLPDGAHFVSFVGTLATGTSAREGENAWVYGFDSTGRAGWVRAASTALEEGCLLSKDSLAGALSMRLDDPALLTALRGNVSLHRGGQSKRGSYFVTESFAAIVERPSNCRSATLDARMELDAPLDELHYGRIAESGDTFFALATEPSPELVDQGIEAWAFYAPRASEPALTLSIPTHPSLPSRRRGRVQFNVRRGPGGARGFWPLSVQFPGDPAPTFYTSDGTTFTEFGAAAPAPAPAPVPAPAP